MNKILLLLLLLVCGLSSQTIIITEIIQNPAAVSDANGEWFEVYNSTGIAININGWTIKDNGTDSHVINNGGSLNVPANGFLVLGRNSNTVTNGGITIGYQYSSITLANGDDELILENASSVEIDKVEWDGGPLFPDPTGASMTLIDFTADNNVGGNWMTSTTRELNYSGAVGDLGSPGSLGSDQSLPVELAYFTAEKSINGTFLEWRTESEIENLGFLIERKTDNTDWKEIASYKNDNSLLGQGTVSSPTDYFFIDSFVEQGNTYEYRLADIDYGGVVTYHTTREITVALNPLPALAEDFFTTAYPNPFNPSTTIRYSVTSDALVQVTVYDISGKLINNLVNNEQSAGWHEVQWNGTNQNGIKVPGGVYLYRVTVGNEVKTSKLILLQ